MYGKSYCLGGSMKGYLTIAEVQARTGFSNGWVNTLLHRGELKGDRAGTMWLVKESSVERYLATKRPLGRPPKASKNGRRRKGAA